MLIINFPRSSFFCVQRICLYVWPATNASKNEDIVIDSFSAFLEQQIRQIDNVQKSISKFERLSNEMVREVSRLKLMKDALIQEVTQIQCRHPQLMQSNSDNVQILKSVKEAIVAFKAANKQSRYPKDLTELEGIVVDDNGAVVDPHNFITPAIFEHAKQQVRADTKPGPKRKRTDSVMG